jgi:hypothetical protein
MPRSEDGRWLLPCEVCGKKFSQRRPGIRTCGVKCRARLPHNTGGPRSKSGLESRACPVCGDTFQPVREKQMACSLACYWKSEPGQASRQRANKRRKEDPEVAAYIREQSRAQFLRVRYGMTVGEYEAKLLAQGGVCVICSKPPKPEGVRAASRLHVDHDHETGRNRDLICLNCNRGLGYFKDDAALMRVAAEYIDRHRERIRQ